METGKKIVRRIYTRLPMPDSLIKQVENMAKRNRAKSGLIFKNRQKEVFDWENEKND